MFVYIIHMFRFLSDHQLTVIRELISGDLQIEGGGALSNPPRGIVMGPVAGTEVAAKLSSIGNGDASQVRADTYSQ